MSRATPMVVFAFMVLAFSLVSARAHASKQARTMENIIDNFVESRSLDDFCEDFEYAFGEECLEDLDSATEKEFLGVATKRDRRNVTRFIKTRLLAHDEDLEMDDMECARFRRKLRNLTPSKFLEFLEGELDERGYQLSTRFKRAASKRKRVEELTQVDSCNMGVYASMVGKYYKPIISPRQMYRTVRRYAADTFGSAECNSWDCHSEL